MATEGVGATTAGLTVPRVTVCPAVAGEAVTTAATVVVVVVVVVEGCWVTAVVVMAAAVVVVVVVVAGSVTTQTAGAMVLMIELTPLGWLETTVLD